RRSHTKVAHGSRDFIRDRRCLFDSEVDIPLRSMGSEIHKREALLEVLPAPTAKSLAKLLSSEKRSAKKLSKAFVEALQQAGFPHTRSLDPGAVTKLGDVRSRGVMPIPADLTPVQRTLAELLAFEDGMELFFHDGTQFQLFCLPETAANRRRWLGIDPGG